MSKNTLYKRPPKSFEQSRHFVNTKYITYDPSLYGRFYNAFREGGGLLTDLTERLTPGALQLLGTVYNVTNLTGAFLKTLVNIIV